MKRIGGSAAVVVDIVICICAGSGVGVAVPCKLFASILDEAVVGGIVEGEMECDGRVTSGVVGFDKSGGVGRGGICVFVPSKGIACSLVINASIRIVDCEVKRDDRIATLSVCLYECGRVGWFNWSIRYKKRSGYPPVKNIISAL